MRPLLVACLTLLSASSASAQIVQDRYGPPRTAPAHAAAAPGQMELASLEPSLRQTPPPDYGRMLSWNGKRASADPPAAELRAAPVPTPISPPARAPAPPAARAPLPDSLYSPPPATKPAAMIGPEASARPAPRPVQAVAAESAHPAPTRPAAPPPTPTPAPLKTAAATPAPPQARYGGTATPRLYSLHRQYGMSPDAVPQPSPAQSRYVLIGPPDGSRDDGDDKPKSSKAQAVF